MKIDFEKYKVKFPKGPKISRLKKPNNRYYKRMLRDIGREGLRR